MFDFPGKNTRANSSEDRKFANENNTLLSQSSVTSDRAVNNLRDATCGEVGK